MLPPPAPLCMPRMSGIENVPCMHPAPPMQHLLLPSETLSQVKHATRCRHTVDAARTFLVMEKTVEDAIRKNGVDESGAATMHAMRRDLDAEMASIDALKRYVDARVMLCSAARARYDAIDTWKTLKKRARETKVQAVEAIVSSLDGLEASWALDATVKKRKMAAATETETTTSMTMALAIRAREVRRSETDAARHMVAMQNHAEHVERRVQKTWLEAVETSRALSKEKESLRQATIDERRAMQTVASFVRSEVDAATILLSVGQRA